MEKKIVILAGSPRKGGNSDLLAEAFAKGAKAGGHTVETFRTADMKIGGCQACETCFSTGKPCTFDDDFNKIAPAVLNADVLVIATPLYWFSFPMQVKAALDKCYSLLRGDKPFNVKECALLVCGADNGTAEFEGIVRSYELIAGYLKWNDLGKVIVTGVSGKGDVLKTDGLERAEKLGASV